MNKLYEMAAKAIAGVALLLVVLTGASLLGAFPVKWAWNYVMPGIFHLKEIGYWEAFSLIWLAGAFVKAAPSGGSKS